MGFVSSAHGIENELIEKSGQQFDTWHKVLGGPLHGVSVPRKFLSLIQLAAGTIQATLILLRQHPDAVFLTGGWVGVPIAVAATILRTPVIIYVPDVEPGKSLKALGRYASVITATVPETAKYFHANKEIIATGYPLREGLLDHSREEGIAAFGLDTDKRTLLVFGGSRGSRAINRVVYQQIEALLQIPDLQVLHISGKLDVAEVKAARAALPEPLQTRYHVHDYVHEMGLALAAADLVVSRAGAATMAEFPAFGLPAILIPLAYDWHYQEVNADWLASRGAAIRLDEPNMETQLVELVHALLTDEKRYHAMQQASLALRNIDGATNVANVIRSRAKKDKQ